VKRILIGERGLWVYATFVAGCGLALTLSMPWTSTLSDLMSYPWRPFPLPFFLTYGFLSAWVALDRAAEAVPVGRPRVAFLAVAALRVGFTQLLALPLVAASRALFPDDWTAIPLAAAYVVAASLAFAAGAVVLEILAVRRGRHPAGLRYGLFFAWLGLPAILLAVAGPIRTLAQLSPAVAVASIVGGEVALPGVLVAFAAPALATVAFTVWCLVLSKGAST